MKRSDAALYTDFTLYYTHESLKLTIKPSQRHKLITEYITPGAMGNKFM